MSSQETVHEGRAPRARRFLARTAAGVLAATAAVVWAPQAAQAEDAPVHGADQIAQREVADLDLEAGRAATVRHADAAFIKVRFEGVVLGERDSLIVASPDRAEVHAYGAADVEDGGLWALSVEGEAAEVVLREAADGTSAAARVAEYSRGLDEAEMDARAGASETESLCGRDDSRNSVCYKETDPQAYDASKSVARLIIGGEYYCTAWLAQGGNRLLTNNHCFSTSAEAKVTEVQFRYECRFCEGGDTRRPIKVTGDKVLATDYTYDFTLFTVADYDRIDHLPHLAIDKAQADRGDKLFIAGHPGGRPMRIASASGAEPPATAGQCQVHDPAYDGRGWDTDVSYLCDTEGGSSGSPVVSRETGKVVGLHHLGGCPNSAVRMDLVYPRIAPYLNSDF